MSSRRGGIDPRDSRRKRRSTRSLSTRSPSPDRRPTTKRRRYSSSRSRSPGHKRQPRSRSSGSESLRSSRSRDRSPGHRPYRGRANSKPRSGAGGRRDSSIPRSPDNETRNRMSDEEEQDSSRKGRQVDDLSGGRRRGSSLASSRSADHSKR
ncbi:uncharacterized protein LY79DRAFT_910 [Colletotrichum navitas]|uniref:Uncharacterized protein n=1 Tax=Colletotrichum navitas TaxID=681940 RepID=A0AAD8QEI3_9PEZI|nr:uncharacterized protein LY79DRAFT_910 [Colletotrichum navitas]KAK1599937.1 hypothetical protein LY79DRAFT_910 [Colletotrichum navitas]